MKGLVCGWGVNDADYQIQVRKPYWADGKKKYKSTFNCPYYRTWLRMLERCHTETYHLYHPSYRGTSVRGLEILHELQVLDGAPVLVWKRARQGHPRRRHAVLTGYVLLCS